MKDILQAGQPVEIADICQVLRRLNASGVLSEHSSNACLRGAFLLRTFRETVFKEGTDAEILSELREVLVSNQEG